MSKSTIRAAIRGASVACALGMAAPVMAQTEMTQEQEDAAFAEIDALSDATANEETGLQLARDQAMRGEYLEAISTLERVLASHPKSHNAKLLHAIYLCRIDDKQGGLVEIDKFKDKDYGEGVLDQARQMCNGGGQ